MRMTNASVGLTTPRRLPLCPIRRKPFPLLASMLFLIAGLAPAQQPAVDPSPNVATPLGAGDEVSIAVVELPEFSAKAYRVDNDGTVSLPLIGRVQAAGFTLPQFE